MKPDAIETVVGDTFLIVRPRALRVSRLYCVHWRRLLFTGGDEVGVPPTN